jgi:pimeloyl-ACP methyl ester carboxylesterase
MRIVKMPSIRRRRLLAAVLIVAGLTGLWIAWSELHPGEERALRALVHDRLDDWFPEVMDIAADGHGLHLRRPADGGDDGADPPAGVGRPRTLLVHGLDEPGILWDDLAPALAEAGFEVWELRYPNDQGIDRSTDYLADLWPTLPADRPVILIGHSMGGLLARDFVTRLRHPVAGPPRVRGAPVGGVIMAGTPNHGSAWARLRIWLELQEHFRDARQRRFSLFAGLRDGLGEAKIDLRPGSAFLERLNARPWPEAVPRFLIGARVVEPPAHLIAGLDAAAAEIGSEALRLGLHAWWDSLGNRIGDGAVTIDSLALPDAPPPLIVTATHRSMLRRLGDAGPEPPAVAPIVAQVRAWSRPQGALSANPR